MINTIAELKGYLRDNWVYNKECYPPEVSRTVKNSKAWKDGLGEQYSEFARYWTDLRYANKHQCPRIKYPKGVIKVSKMRELISTFKVPIISFLMFNEGFSFSSPIAFKFRAINGDLVKVWNNPITEYHRKYGSRLVKNIYTTRVSKSRRLATIGLIEPSAWALLRDEMNFDHCLMLIACKHPKMLDNISKRLKKGK